MSRSGYHEALTIPGDLMSTSDKTSDIKARYLALQDEFNAVVRGRRIRITGKVRDQPIGCSKPLLTGREYVVKSGGFTYRDLYVSVEGLRTAVRLSNLDFIDE